MSARLLLFAPPNTVVATRVATTTAIASVTLVTNSAITLTTVATASGVGAPVVGLGMNATPATVATAVAVNTPVIRRGAAPIAAAVATVAQVAVPQFVTSSRLDVATVATISAVGTPASGPDLGITPTGVTRVVLLSSSPAPFTDPGEATIPAFIPDGDPFVPADRTRLVLLTGTAP